MPACVFRQILQMHGNWPCIEHVFGGYDVVVDDRTLCLIMRAFLNNEIIEISATCSFLR